MAGGEQASDTFLRIDVKNPGALDYRLYVDGAEWPQDGAPAAATEGTHTVRLTSSSRETLDEFVIEVKQGRPARSATTWAPCSGAQRAEPPQLSRCAFRLRRRRLTDPLVCRSTMNCGTAMLGMVRTM